MMQNILYFVLLIEKFVCFTVTFSFLLIFIKNRLKAQYYLFFYQPNKMEGNSQQIYFMQTNYENGLMKSHDTPATCVSIRSKRSLNDQNKDQNSFSQVILEADSKFLIEEHQQIKMKGQQLLKQNNGNENIDNLTTKSIYKVNLQRKVIIFFQNIQSNENQAFQQFQIDQLENYSQSNKFLEPQSEHIQNDKASLKDFYSLNLQIPQNSQRQSYKLYIAVKLQKGFQRCIHIEDLKKVDNEAETSSLTDENKISIKYDLKTLKLSIDLPKSKITQIIQLRNNLLNKSTILNEIQTLMDLKGILYQLSCQNMGSRIIQKILHINKGQGLLFYNEVQNQIPKLMMDNFGNYVIQKMYYTLSIQMKTYFLHKIYTFIPEVSKTKSGTHCLQYIFDKSLKNGVTIIIDSVLNNLEDLCTNQFSSHFIRKIIKQSNSQKIIQLLLNEQMFEKLSVTKFGVLCLKTLLISLYDNPLQKQYLVRFFNLSENKFIKLNLSQFGHFLAEQIVKNFNYFELINIRKIFKENLSLIANSAYGSNIISITLQRFPQEWHSQIVKLVLDPQNTLLFSMISQSSGSFVLHKIIQRFDTLNCSKNQKTKKTVLLGKIKEHLPSIKLPERRLKWSKFLKSVNF